MFKKNEWFWHVVAIVLPLVVFAFLFNKFSFSDFQKPWVISGDGMKSVFCFTDYVRTGEGLYLKGLNYPYGELISYTDNMPLFAVVFKLINEHVVSLAGYEHRIFYIILFFQWVLSGYFLFLLFRVWNVSRIFCLFSAFGVLLLSSQLQRIIPHPNLSFVLLIVLYFLLISKLIKNQRIVVNGLLLFLLVFFSTFIHIYYLFLFSIFSGFLMLMSLWRKNIGLLSSVGVSLFLAGMSAFLLIKSVDNRDDRAKLALGMGDYDSDFEGTFYPNYGRVNAFIKKITKSNYEPNFEKKNYLGFLNIAFVFVTIFFWLKSFLGGGDNVLFVSKDLIYYIFWPSVLCWVFSLGVVIDFQRFVFPDLRTPLDQFRSMARLSWMTYIGLSLYTICFIDKIRSTLFARKRYYPAFGLIGFAISILFVDAYPQAAPVFRKIAHPEDIFVFEQGDDIRRLLESQGYSLSDFEATLTLPLSNLGSEKIHGEANGDWFLNYAYFARLTTGLPSLGFALSRTSLRQACNLNQLFTEEIYVKERLEDMGGGKILVMADSNFLTLYDKTLLRDAVPIGSYKQVTLYSLDQDALSAKLFDKRRFQDRIRHLSGCQGLLAADCNNFVFYPRANFSGIPRILHQEHLADGDGVFEIDIKNLRNRKVLFSAWYNITKHTEGGPYPIIELLDENGNVLFEKYFNHFSNYNFYKNWRKIEYYFDFSSYPGLSSLRHRFETMNQPVRNILIRDVSEDVFYVVSDSIIWMNNDRLRVQ